MTPRELQQYRKDSDAAEKNRKHSKFIRLQKKNAPYHDHAKSTLITFAAVIGALSADSITT